jgi:hypothetical protein
MASIAGLGGSVFGDVRKHEATFGFGCCGRGRRLRWEDDILSKVLDLKHVEMRIGDARANEKSQAMINNSYRPIATVDCERHFVAAFLRSGRAIMPCVGTARRSKQYS